MYKKETNVSFTVSIYEQKNRKVVRIKNPAFLSLSVFPTPEVTIVDKTSQLKFFSFNMSHLNPEYVTLQTLAVKTDEFG